ncbi:HET-domain-containing protein, partial [Thozetella sp. PMI_491]
MRLIEVTTLRVVEASDDHGKPPRYAILSHTWGNDEDEVLLREMQGEPLPALSPPVKLGFGKIRRSAEMAKTDFDLPYVWVDTCCIDKTSSSELSEAINTMYRWYQEAKICFAYLSDVSKPSGNDSRSMTEAMRASRWFTRGWTLQELIAPAEVIFFDKDWAVLGRKSEPKFRASLTQITGIDPSVLAGLAKVQDISIGDRMKFASRRETKRREDLAYCLLGLFDVNMPLLYGEGSRAFIRLQEEIMKVSDDQSIFAWQLPEQDRSLSPICGLLAPSPRCFETGLRTSPLPSLILNEPTTITGAGLRSCFYIR